MDYEFHKRKLPKGFSYPIKRSVLDEILEKSETERIKWITFSVDRRGDIIVWANFVGEAHKTTSAGKIGLYVYAVPSDERKETEELLIKQIFPKFIKWLRKVEAAGEGWRLTTRLLEIELKDGELSFSETK